MNKPSVKTLERAFPGKGKELRSLLTSSEAVNNHPAAIELERVCYHPPTMAHKRMVAIDAALQNFGVEYIKGNGSSQSFEYSNTGDSYDATIVRFSNGRYIVSSWGDIVERGNYS